MNGPSAPTNAHVSRRRVLEWAIPAAAVAVVIIGPLLVWDRLPDPMATHWGLGGRPDGAMPRIADLLVLALGTVLVGFSPLLATRLRMPRSQARILVAAATGGSTLFAVLRVVTLRANLEATSWESAGDFGAATFAAAFAAAVVAAAVGVWAAGDRPDHQPPTTTTTPVEAVRGQTLVWTGQATGRMGTVVPVALLGAAAVAGWLAPAAARPMLMIVLPVVALALTTLGQARVTIGRRGMTVSLGWLGWPRLSVPAADIARVTVEDVAPMAYGGWGLRAVPGATAVVIRSGPAIRIERTSGRVFVVTVDDAARGAGVLAATAEAAST
ncbi:MAG TPA: DUF1648 domain-containing protein [Egicoccus sp.]|nr:DUF1648 domain-containing protein [Egicoccus sp.]HSK23197.1 DUF1648 domain-containing protein [Egicoccus sp.]